jgi:hypothetical protein
MINRKLFTELDGRDELIISLLAGVIPLLSLAAMAYQ